MKAPWKALYSHNYDERVNLPVPAEVMDPPPGPLGGGWHDQVWVDSFIRWFYWFYWDPICSICSINSICFYLFYKFYLFYLFYKFYWDSIGLIDFSNDSLIHSFYWWSCVRSENLRSAWIDDYVFFFFVDVKRIKDSLPPLDEHELYLKRSIYCCCYYYPVYFGCRFSIVQDFYSLYPRPAVLDCCE